MEQNQPNTWVRLYLEKQSENSSMPDSIVGVLSQETPNSYVLSKVLDYKENEDTFEMEAVEVEGYNFISRTYVWRCEVLNELPTSEPYNGTGGLG